MVEANRPHGLGHVDGSATPRGQPYIYIYIYFFSCGHFSHPHTDRFRVVEANPRPNGVGQATPKALGGG
jgi:hypothetical protein